MYRIEYSFRSFHYVIDNLLKILFVGLMCVVCVPTTDAAKPRDLKKMSLTELTEAGMKKLVEENRPDTALIYFSEASSRYKPSLSDEDKILVIRSLNNQGYILCNYYNRLDDSYTSFAQGRDICEDNPQIQGSLALIGMNMANLFSRYQELSGDDRYSECAKIILAHAFEDGIEAKKWGTVVQLFINMTSFGFEKDEMSRIKPYIDRFDKLPIPADTRLLRFARNRSKALHAIEMGKYAEAENYFQRQTNNLDALVSLERYEVQVLADLALLARTKKDNEGYKNYLMKIQDLARLDNMPDLELSVALYLERFFREQGDSAGTDRWKLRYYELRDSIYPKGLSKISDHPSMADEIARIDGKKKAYKEQKTSIDVSSVYLWIVVAIVLALGGGICVVIVHRKKRGEDAHGVSEANVSKPAGDPSGVVEKYRTSPLGASYKERLAAVITDCLEKNEECYSPDFSVGRLAELCGSKPSYVSQTINEYFGKNFNSLLNAYRIQRACREMKNSNRRYTIESIAAGVGFRSRSSFLAAFKKEMGMTPSEYLKQS